MTEEYYYNCLVPNALVSMVPERQDNEDEEAVAPPIPPRLHEQGHQSAFQVLRSPKGPDDEVFQPCKAIRWQSSESLLQHNTGLSVSPEWAPHDRAPNRHASTPEKWQTFENLDISEDSYSSRSPSWGANNSGESCYTSGISFQHLDTSTESHMSRKSSWSPGNNSSEGFVLGQEVGFGSRSPHLPGLMDMPLPDPPQPPLLPPRPQRSVAERQSVTGEHLSQSLGSLKSSWRTNSERLASDFPLPSPRRYEYHQVIQSIHTAFYFTKEIHIQITMMKKANENKLIGGKIGVVSNSWLVGCTQFKATLTAKVISWRLVTHMERKFT